MVSKRDILLLLTLLNGYFTIPYNLVLYYWQINEKTLGKYTPDIFFSLLYLKRTLKIKVNYIHMFKSIIISHLRPHSIYDCKLGIEKLVLPCLAYLLNCRESQILKWSQKSSLGIDRESKHVRLSWREYINMLRKSRQFHNARNICSSSRDSNLRL